MKSRLKIFLMLLVTLGLSIQMPLSDRADAASCPDQWQLKFEPISTMVNPSNSKVLNPLLTLMRLDIFNETTGNLEKNKQELGQNLAIQWKAEFSTDNRNWVEMAWPMKFPDEGYFEFGSKSWLYLYPGFARLAITLEVKGCEKLGIFTTDSYRYPETVLKDGYSLEDLIGKSVDFRATEALVKDINNQIENAKSQYAKTGRIQQNFPVDDPRVWLTPKSPGCMSFVGPHPGYWKSDGKTCEMFFFSDFIELNGTRVSFVNPAGDLVAPHQSQSSLASLRRVLFVANSLKLEPLKKSPVASPTATSISAKSNSVAVKKIVCVKGKTTMSIKSPNPKCPKGFKEK